MSREKELEKLLEVSALLTSTLDLGSLLTQVLEAAEKLMNASASNVMLVDTTTHELVYQVALGQAGSQIKEQKRLKFGVGIAGWVAQNEKPLLIEDAYQDPRFFSDFDRKTGFKTKSILCIPLHAKGKLIGIAQIINKKSADHFTQADLELFSRFGNIVAVAIDNALLHRQILEQDRLKRDMEIAEEIQRAALPIAAPEVKNLRLDFRSVPCRQVGGDVVEVASLGEDRIAVLIADVSGKGVPAALFGAKFSTEFKYELQRDPDGDSLFNRLNQIVAERTTRGMFVTAIYGVIDARTGKVKLVNAGHPAPFIVGPKEGETRVVETLEFPPLGILSDQKYEMSEMLLQPGQHLVLITDGVTEAKGPSGDRFGDKATFATLDQGGGNPMMALFEKVGNFTQGEAPADDVTVVDLRYGDYEQFEMNSDPAQLAEVRQLIDRKAREVGFSEKTQGRITLAVTESLANVIKHTYKMDSGGKIRLGVGASRDQLEVFIRDWGPRQDPKKFISRKLEDIRPGGLGVHYIQQTMTVVQYDSTLRDGNELYMMIRKTEGT